MSENQVFVEDYMDLKEMLLDKTAEVLTWQPLGTQVLVVCNKIERLNHLQSQPFSYKNSFQLIIELMDGERERIVLVVVIILQQKNESIMRLP